MGSSTTFICIPMDRWVVKLSKSGDSEHRMNQLGVDYSPQIVSRFNYIECCIGLTLRGSQMMATFVCP